MNNPFANMANKGVRGESNKITTLKDEFLVMKFLITCHDDLFQDSEPINLDGYRNISRSWLKKKNRYRIPLNRKSICNLCQDLSESILQHKPICKAQCDIQLAVFASFKKICFEVGGDPLKNIECAHDEFDDTVDVCLENINDGLHKIADVLSLIAHNISKF